MKCTKKVSAKKVKKIAQEELKGVSGGSPQTQTEFSCRIENGARVCTGSGTLGPVNNSNRK